MLGSTRKQICVFFIFAKTVVDSVFLDLIGSLKAKLLRFPGFKWMEIIKRYWMKELENIAGTDESLTFEKT